MSDLIRRQDAIDALDRFSLGETDAVKLAFRMGDYLKRLPSADVQPVRHGHWIYTPTSPLGFTCSECGKEMCLFNYCPHCGAKMDEVT